jgi:hypothetical protein
MTKERTGFAAGASRVRNRLHGRLATPVDSSWGMTPAHPIVLLARRLAHRVFRSGMMAAYSAGDRDSAQIRAAHLNSVIRLTPYTMAANLGNGALVIWAWRDDVSLGMLAWLVLLYALCGFALLGWWRGRDRVRTLATPAAIRHANVHAKLLALVWAALPILWFAHASSQQQLLVTAMVTGMLAAAAFVLSPLPVAAVWYVVIFASSGVIACWRAGDRIFVAVGVLPTLYALIVILGTLAMSRKATALLQSQGEAKRQERMMAVLLHDFEQNAAEALWETRLDVCIAHHSPRLAVLLGAGRRPHRAAGTDLPGIAGADRCRRGAAARGPGQRATVQGTAAVRRRPARAAPLVDQRQAPWSTRTATPRAGAARSPTPPSR